MKNTKNLRIAVLLIVPIILAVFIFRLNINKPFQAFIGIRWSWVIGAGLLNILNTWVEAFRWKLILSPVKKDIRVYRTFNSILVGIVGNTILPFRLGDGARAYFLAKKENIHLASVFSTVFLDRIADVTFFLLLVTITAFLYPFPSSVKRISILVGGVIAIFLIILIVLNKFRKHIKLRFEGKLNQKIAEQIKRLVAGLYSLKSSGLLFPTGILSIISWLMRLMIVWVMTIAFRMNLSLIASTVVLIITNLGIAVVSTPANLGGFEISAAAALRLFQGNTENAISCAIALHLVEVVPVVLLGLIVICYSGFSLKFGAVPDNCG